MKYSFYRCTFIACYLSVITVDWQSDFYDSYLTNYPSVLGPHATEYNGDQSWFSSLCVNHTVIFDPCHNQLAFSTQTYRMGWISRKISALQCHSALHNAPMLYCVMVTQRYILSSENSFVRMMLGKSLYIQSKITTYPRFVNLSKVWRQVISQETVPPSLYSIQETLLSLWMLMNLWKHTSMENRKLIKDGDERGFYTRSYYNVYI